MRRSFAATGRALSLLAALTVFFTCGWSRPGESCSYGAYDVVTDDFFVSATTVDGASGGVVGVEISITVEALQGSLRHFAVVASYDDTLAELAGTLPSEFTTEFMTFQQLIRSEESSSTVSYSGRKGFQYRAHLTDPARDIIAEEIARSGAIVFPVATVYFRLNGAPGESFQVRFQNAEFGSGFAPGGDGRSCLASQLSYIWAPDGFTEAGRLHARSTRHVHGEVTITDGEPVDPPVLPPEATVYDKAPTPAEAGVVFELSGGAIVPGAENVPLEFYVTSRFDWVGYAVAASFPPEYIELAHVEDHLTRGAHYVENDTGHFSHIVLGGTRRLGAEHDRVHVATFYVNIREAASEVTEIPVSLGPFNGQNGARYINWIGVRHRGGTTDDEIPITAKIETLTRENSLLFVLPDSAEFIRGDSNGDETVNVSDPQLTLGYLFLGTRGPTCFDAADANDDGTIDIADPIRTLQFLFLEGGLLPAPYPEKAEDPTHDAMTCLLAGELV